MLINDFLPESQKESYHMFDSSDGDGLPSHSRYVIVERYCENPSCDCNDLVATISQIDQDNKLVERELAIIRYCWASKKRCYPELDDESPKTKIAHSLLKIYQTFIHNADYLLRVKKHYALVKKLSAEKMLHEESIGKNQPQAIKTQKVGRNDACPCGSNKKYKKCCINKAIVNFEN